MATYHIHCMQEVAEGGNSRSGLMSMLNRSKEPVPQPVGASAPASQPKPGRFANLRAKLSKPSEYAEVGSDNSVLVWRGHRPFDKLR